MVDEVVVPATKPVILVVVGTRPEAIKMVPVIRELQASELLQPLVLSTGQHPDLVDSVLALAGVTADIDLAVARPGLSLNELFSAVVGGVEVKLRERFGPPDSSLDGGRQTIYPAAALVHGDTSSAAAAAISAFHLRMPVIHVEAGLRTNLSYSPFPEEINRQIISRIASFHLAPTWQAEENLLHEGVPFREVFVTGNTGVDAIQWAAGLETPIGDPALAELIASDRRIIVVTAHRRENWGLGIDRIGAAIRVLAERNPDVSFVIPVHPNPLVADSLRARLSNLPNVLLLPPLDYTTFASLLRRAHFAISDSGGVQEEAPAVGTPVLVTRSTTERGEAVEAGTVRLVGTDVDTIVRESQRLLDDDEAHREMAGAPSPFGDGHAAERIVRVLEHLSYGTPKPERFGSELDRAYVLQAAGFNTGLIETAMARPGRGLVEPPPALPAEPALEEGA